MPTWYIIYFILLIRQISFHQSSFLDAFQFMLVISIHFMVYFMDIFHQYMKSLLKELTSENL